VSKEVNVTVTGSLELSDEDTELLKQASPTQVMQTLIGHGVPCKVKVGIRPAPKPEVEG
jgi:hypothetical protein